MPKRQPKRSQSILLAASVYLAHTITLSTSKLLLSLWGTFPESQGASAFSLFVLCMTSQPNTLILNTIQNQFANHWKMLGLFSFVLWTHSTTHRCVCKTRNPLRPLQAKQNEGCPFWVADGAILWSGHWGCYNWQTLCCGMMSKVVVVLSFTFDIWCLSALGGWLYFSKLKFLLKHSIQ